MAVADQTSAKERITIILHSGAYDRASYALCIAQAALACGIDVHMLLTFEGLRRFTQGHLTQIGEETPSTVKPDLLQGLEMGSIQPLDEQLAELKEMGLKIYACPNALASCRIPLRDIIGLDEPMGLVAFLQLAKGAQSSWYI
jgi:peroxiredoxin family protein